MSYFSNNKILIGVVVILVLLNVFSLSALFVQHKRMANFRMMDDRPDQKPPRFDKIERFMKKEIGFSEEQIDSFRISRKAHSEAMQHLNMEIHKRKKQLMDGAFDEAFDDGESQKLMREIGEIQARIEETSQNHLMEMSRLCQPGQKEKLKHLLEEAMVRHRPDFPDRDHRAKGEKPFKKENRDRNEFKPN